MPDEMMNTREVAGYLGIHEKQVYALIKAKKIPCTRITGKWVFPKKLIDDWILGSSLDGYPDARIHSNRLQNMILAAGSNDPILDILLNDIKNVKNDFYIFSCSTGSTRGIELLAEEKTQIAWCHLYDPETGQFNIPYIKKHLKDHKIAIIHLFHRQIGFVYSHGIREPVKEFNDIGDGSLRFINRQKGSGTRILLDHYLEKNSIDHRRIRGYENEVFTHFEVGLSILEGSADVGIATVAVSQLMNLSFSPVINESFDMVLHQDTFFNNGIQVFIETMQSGEFRQKVKPLGDYDFSESGKIIFSTTQP